MLQMSNPQSITRGHTLRARHGFYPIFAAYPPIVSQVANQARWVPGDKGIAVEVLKRFWSLFSWRKIWGTALAGLGLLGQLIHWGWISLDVLGRADVGWRIAETMGGSVALAATILSSWQFSLALIVVGLTYIIFVGEPEAGVKRHPSLPYIASAVLFICIAAMGSIAIYGWYELQIRNAYADGSNGIPRNESPANRQSTSNQRPLYPDGQRLLTPDQQRILITQGGKMHKELGKFLVGYLSTDGDAVQYSSSFQIAFSHAAIDSELIGLKVLGDPSEEGLLIFVADKSAPPPEAKKLEELLTLADIPVRFATSTMFNSKALPVVLFVGPRPIQR